MDNRPPRLPTLSISSFGPESPGLALPPRIYTQSDRSSLASSTRVSFRDDPRRSSRATSTAATSVRDALAEYEESCLSDTDTTSVNGLEYRLELNLAVKEIMLLGNNLKALHVLTDAVQQGSTQLGPALSSLTTESSGRLQTIFTSLRQLGGEAVTSRKQLQLAEALRLFKACLEEIRVGEWNELSCSEQARRRLAERVRKAGPRAMSSEDVDKALDAAEEKGKVPITTFAGMWALEHPFAELRATIRGADALFLILAADYSSQEFTRPKSWMNRSRASLQIRKNEWKRQRLLWIFFVALLLVLAGAIAGLVVGLKLRKD